MNLLDRLNELFWYLLTAAVVALSAAAWRLARKVFTNAEEVKLMKHYLEERDLRIAQQAESFKEALTEQREEFREALGEVKQGLLHIQQLFIEEGVKRPRSRKGAEE